MHFASPPKMAQIFPVVSVKGIFISVGLICRMERVIIGVFLNQRDIEYQTRMFNIMGVP